MLKIRGYDKGDNITLLNVIYNKSKKMANGKYSKDSVDIVYKDLNTGEKKFEHIDEPNYTYYIANDGVECKYNKLFIEKEKVHPITTAYNNIKKSIAEQTNNLNFFYENIRNKNFRANDQLFTIPTIFNADMDIEDYVRYEFDKTYKNDVCSVSKLFFDIETDNIDMKGTFPEPGECPVNAVTLINEENKTVYTLLLENNKNKLIDEFKATENLQEKIKEFVKFNVGGWKQEYIYGLHEYNYQVLFYKDEVKLLYDVFNIINTLKPDFAVAWNAAFDLPYLIARIQKLGYDPKQFICHKDFKQKTLFYHVDATDFEGKSKKFEQRCDYAAVSSYTTYLCQMITYVSIRKGQKKVSARLDEVGRDVAKVRKLDYSHITTNISKLPYLNYYIFVLYNIMDVVAQKCIETNTGDIDFVFSKSLMAVTRYGKIHRQTTYLVNVCTKEFYKKGYIIGCNCNSRNNKAGFPGAFVADPTKVSDDMKMKINGRPINVLNNLVDFDYTALYPSEIDESNMSPNTMIGKITGVEYGENKYNNEYFDGIVWLMEDYVCGDRLNFCNRCFNLGTYENVYDDIMEYYTKLKRPNSGIVVDYDKSTGKRYMIHNTNNLEKRVMCVNTKEKQQMVRNVNRVDYNIKNNLYKK